MNRIVNSTIDSARSLIATAADVRELSEFAGAYQRRLGKLERAHRQGDLKGARHHTNEILTSAGAKICVAVRKARPKLGEPPFSFTQIRDRAGQLDPFVPIPEPVNTWLVPKPAGGYRQLTSFGWRRRALQLVCEDILTAVYPVDAFGYSEKGMGGVKAATLALHKMIKEGGYQYVVTIDIKDCFRSAIKKKVGELLPLPKTVTNNVLLIQDDVEVVVKPDKGTWKGFLLPNMLPITSATATDEVARRGIPQGSSSSGIIMYRAVIGPLLRTLPFADRMVLIGDDLAVAVKDVSEGEAVLEAVKSLYATSPVGLLTIGRHSVRHIEGGVDFTSYHTRLRRKWKVNYGGEVEWELHVRPTLRAYEKMEHRAAVKYHEAGGGQAGWKQVVLYLKRWIASFPLWKPNHVSKGYIWAQLQAGEWH